MVGDQAARNRAGHLAQPGKTWCCRLTRTTPGPTNCKTNGNACGRRVCHLAHLARLQEICPNENPATLAGALQQLIAPPQHPPPRRVTHGAHRHGQVYAAPTGVYVNTITSRNYTASTDKSLKVVAGAAGAGASSRPKAVPRQAASARASRGRQATAARAPRARLPAAAAACRARVCACIWLGDAHHVRAPPRPCRFRKGTAKACTPSSWPLPSTARQKSSPPHLGHHLGAGRRAGPTRAAPRTSDRPAATGVNRPWQRRQAPAR